MTTPSLPPVIPPTGMTGAPTVIGAPPPRRSGGGSWRYILAVLLLVVVGLIGFVGLRMYQFVQWRRAQHFSTGGAEFFRQASHTIGPKGPAASGNSERATLLAADMSAAMTQRRDEGYSKSKEKALLDTQDTFKTYCELRSNECVFLVHIPELRRFTTEAQTSLANDTWGVAQLVLAKENAGKKGMKVAVGVKGLLLYDRVMTGRWTADFKEDQPAKTGLDQMEDGPNVERLLYDWFQPEVTNAPPVVQP